VDFNPSPNSTLKQENSYELKLKAIKNHTGFLGSEHYTGQAEEPKPTRLKI
jgi:hypothetical protein